MVNLRVFGHCAKAVIYAAAQRLYLPKHWSFSRHKIWYCPFNTGGYTLGFERCRNDDLEMRFIALRYGHHFSYGTIAEG